MGADCGGESVRCTCCCCCSWCCQCVVVSNSLALARWLAKGPGQHGDIDHGGEAAAAAATAADVDSAVVAVTLSTVLEDCSSAELWVCNGQVVAALYVGRHCMWGGIVCGAALYVGRHCGGIVVALYVGRMAEHC
jgi:hypothetical protein